MEEHGSVRKLLPGAGMRRLKIPDEEQPHWCFPLTDPAWVAPGDARHMRPDDPVLGLEFNGGTWALPWWIMKNHHIANLTLNGKEVLVTLCEVCSAAGAFDPVINGQRHSFKLGGIFNGTVMPRDYESGSLWTGFSGQAIEGPLAGHVMERLPLLQCTWGEWLHMHPGSLVPDGEGESREGHGEGRAPGSPYIGPDMGDLLTKLDTRLPHYELVLGAIAGGKSRCYPLAVLGERNGVVNDSLGGRDIVVLGQPGSWMATAFERKVGEQALTWEVREGRFVDRESGSIWTVSGKCVEGKLSGSQLKYLHSGVEEFFLWAAFNPGTEIFGHGTSESRGNAGRQWLATDAIPAPVYAAVKQKWLGRGMRLLDIASGEGMIAALLAEVGLNVVGLDTSQKNVDRARLHFRGVANLEFVQGDLISGPRLKGTFEAVIDHGFFSSLPAEQRGQYVQHLAKLTNPGAHLMLLMPAPAAAVSQRTGKIKAIFAPVFKLVDASPTQIPDLRSGRLVEGVVVRLERAR